MQTWDGVVQYEADDSTDEHARAHQHGEDLISKLTSYTA